MINNWPNHYYALIYTAVKEYLERHPELAGTCVEYQCKDVLEYSKTHYREY
jgi:hypothetical protein